VFLGHIDDEGPLKDKKMALKCHSGSDELDVEYELQLKCKHANVIEVFPIRNVPKLDNAWSRCLPMELGDGTLTDEIKKAPMAPDRAKTVFKGILEGLAHIHSLHLAHRDIKPDNILMTKGVGKITDFGLTTYIDDANTDGYLVPYGAAGTPLYMSDADLNVEWAPGSTVHDFRPQDIWGLGASLREALTGENPKAFTDNTLQKAFESKKEDFAQFKDLLGKLMDPSREKRITAADALKHPWFTGGKLATLYSSTKKVIATTAKILTPTTGISATTKLIAPAGRRLVPANKKIADRANAYLKVANAL